MKRIFLLLAAAIFLSGCMTQYANRSPVGEIFPSVSGQSLEKQTKQVPEDFANKKTLLLLGYVQDAQFDIDRWLIGLDMTKTRVDAYELPTIQGMFPRFFQTQIDNGMRAGIPKEMWKGVITIYDGGEEVQKFTGNKNPRNARVVLLNEQGEVVYFYDRGFAVEALNQLRETL